MHNLRPSFEHSFRKTRNCFVQDSFLSNHVAHKRFSPRSKHSPLLSTQRSIINIRVAEPEIVIDRKFRSSLYQTSLRRLKKQHIKSTLEESPKINMISPSLQEQSERQKGKKYSQVKNQHTINLEVNETEPSIFSMLEPLRKKRSSRTILNLNKRKMLFKSFEAQQFNISQQKSVPRRLQAYNQNNSNPRSTLTHQTLSPPALKPVKYKALSYSQTLEKGLSADRKLPAVFYRPKEPEMAYKALSYQEKRKQKIKEKQHPKETAKIFSSKYSPHYFY